MKGIPGIWRGYRKYNGTMICVIENTQAALYAAILSNCTKEKSQLRMASHANKKENLHIGDRCPGANLLEIPIMGAYAPGAFSTCLTYLAQKRGACAGDDVN
eukprot:1161362-Pelagomonas_calceolata.AAC.2